MIVRRVSHFSGTFVVVSSSPDTALSSEPVLSFARLSHRLSLLLPATYLSGTAPIRVAHKNTEELAHELTSSGERAEGRLGLVRQ